MKKLFPLLTTGHEGGIFAEVSKTFLTIRRFERRFGPPFAKIPFPYLRRNRCLFDGVFLKTFFEKIVFLTKRRKKRCFGTPIFQKIALPYLRRFEGAFGGLFFEKTFKNLPFPYLRRFTYHFGELFLEKSFDFHYTEISKSFLGPYLQKRAFVEFNPRGLSNIGWYYNDNIFGFGTLRKLVE